MWQANADTRQALAGGTSAPVRGRNPSRRQLRHVLLEDPRGAPNEQQ